MTCAILASTEIQFSSSSLSLYFLSLTERRSEWTFFSTLEAVAHLDLASMASCPCRVLVSFLVLQSGLLGDLHNAPDLPAQRRP